MIKTIKFKGNKLNYFKFDRLIAKKSGGLKSKEIHLVATTQELIKLCQSIHQRFGIDNSLAVNIPAVPKEKAVLVSPKTETEIETVALFGMVGEEVEI